MDVSEALQTNVRADFPEWFHAYPRSPALRQTLSEPGGSESWARLKALTQEFDDEQSVEHFGRKTTGAELTGQICTEASSSLHCNAESSTSGSATLLEAALEAWTDCNPNGYILPAKVLRNFLPSIAFRIPRAYQSPGCVQVLRELFLNDMSADGSEQKETSVFEQMVKAHNGQVHFLYFWSAYSRAARLLASLGGERDSDMRLGDEALSLELETLRDAILRTIETAEVEAAELSSLQSSVRRRSRPSSESSKTAAPELASKTQGEADEFSSFRSSSFRSTTTDEEANGKQVRSTTSRRSRSRRGRREHCVPLEMLVDSLHSAANMSSSPAFWLTTEQGFLETAEASGTYRFSMEELTVVMLSWLRDAIAWQQDHTEPSQSSFPQEMETAMTKPEPQGSDIVETPVFLHIYDVSQEESVQRVNKWLHKIRFGGIFHAGVEVHGLEWSFAMISHETMSGISCVEPRTHPDHHYRKTVKLRNTKFTGEEIAALMSQLIEEYPGDDYDLLRRNCCHFADDFCRRLGAGRIPRWVYRLARIGARIDKALQVVSGRTLFEPESYSDDEEEDWQDEDYDWEEGQ